MADFSAIDVRTSLEGCQFGIESRSGRCELSTPLIGLHNVYNCMAAATVARRLGLDWDLIRHGIEQLSGVPARLEAVRCGQPFPVFVDYADTSEALASVLQGLRGLTSGKLLCLFGAGGDRDRGKRPLMAQAAESAADVIVLASDNPRTEDPEQIITEIAAGFSASRATAIKPDRKQAIEPRRRAAPRGVMVKRQSLLLVNMSGSLLFGALINLGQSNLLNYTINLLQTALSKT